MLSPVLTTMLAGFVTLLHPDGGQDQAGVSLGEARRDAPAARLAEEVRRYGWLVFSARSERGDWDLFVCRPDGSDRRNLTRTPESNEAAAQFSRDGRRFLFRRLPVGEPIDGNHYGAQGELMLAGSDGWTPTVLGQGGEYPWASWSPDGKQVACLSVKGISIVDVATRQVVRKLPRRGFFQQLTWSPDGRWLSGVSNSFGASWSVALIEIATGKAHAVSGADCCTPDWFPDSRRLVFSNRPAGQSENHGNGWTQLWMADADGRNRRLVYGEDGRHIYGGQVSPDGKYVVFTENVQEIGDPRHAGAPMGLLRLADAPIIGGESRELRKLHPEAKRGPVLVLPTGWEPCWTDAEVFAATTMNPGTEQDPTSSQGAVARQQPQPAAAVSSLAAELHAKGWIAFSALSDLGGWDLFVMRPDGSQRSELTRARDCPGNRRPRRDLAGQRRRHRKAGALRGGKPAPLRELCLARWSVSAAHAERRRPRPGRQLANQHDGRPHVRHTGRAWYEHGSRAEISPGQRWSEGRSLAGLGLGAALDLCRDRSPHHPGTLIQHAPTVLG